jgi:hypothetical protein
MKKRKIIRRRAINAHKSSILNAVKNITEGESVWIRKATPKETLRFMGVNDRFIDRMVHPVRELEKLGYNGVEIEGLLTVNGERQKVSDRDLYFMAGNSIVVSMLQNVFRAMFIDNMASDVAEICGK